MNCSLVYCIVVGSMVLLLKSNRALAFVSLTAPETRQQHAQQKLLFSSSSSTKSASSSSSTLAMPTSWDEMIRQAATAMREAQTLGTTRQIVRVMLPRDASNDRLGTFYESSNTDDMSSSTSSFSSSGTRMTLVPPDESWQGGIMQLYRAAAPTAERILRQLVSSQAAASSGLPPRLAEDRSIDESGVDGVGLIVSDDQFVQCFVQPTQELVDDVVIDAASKASNSDGKQLIVLLNPQWRQVDDALDAASQGEGFLSGLASFLGGKGATLKRLKAAGFEPVYTLEGYVCRGRNVRLLKILDSDWSIFYQSDDDESDFVALGQLPKTRRPTYQDVDALMSQAGVSLGYARDMGL